MSNAAPSHPSPNPGRRAEPTRARIAPSRSGSSPAACCARSRTRPTRRPARSTACAASASISPERNAPSRQRSGSCSPSPLWPRRSIPERPRQTLRSALPRYGKAIGASRRAHPNRRRRASQDIQRGARTERRREPTPACKKTTVDEYPTRASIAVLEGMDALEPDMETRLAQIRVYVVGMVVLVNQLHHELVHLAFASAECALRRE